jgi:hypothetical protein
MRSFFTRIEQVFTEKKQSASQVTKKSKSKSKTAEMGLSPERMKELAQHDARREIRKSEAKRINKKVATPSQLNDAEKDRLDKKMDSKTIENKIEKLTKKKLKEKQLSQQEKDLRKQARETSDSKKKKELNKKASELKDQIQNIKDSYTAKKKEETKED